MIMHSLEEDELNPQLFLWTLLWLSERASSCQRGAQGRPENVPKISWIYMLILDGIFIKN